MNDDAEAVRALLQLHRTTEALERAERALATDPHQPEIVLLCALAHLRLDDAHTALVVAMSGCANFPDQPWMHQIRGRALGALGRNSEAVEALHEAVRLDPVDAHHLVGLSEELIDLAGALPRGAPEVRDLLRQAMDAAERARALAPRDAMTSFAVARAHLAQGNWNAAAAAAAEGLAIDPEDPRGHAIAGAAAAGQSDIGRAGDHFLAAARADPHRSDGIDLLRSLRERTPLWITVAVLLGVPVLAWVDGTWSDALWIVVAVGLAIAGWIIWRSRGRLSDDARTALRRSRRLR